MSDQTDDRVDLRDWLNEVPERLDFDDFDLGISRPVVVLWSLYESPTERLRWGSAFRVDDVLKFNMPHSIRTLDRAEFSTWKFFDAEDALRVLYNYVLVDEYRVPSNIAVRTPASEAIADLERALADEQGAAEERSQLLSKAWKEAGDLRKQLAAANRRINDLEGLARAQHDALNRDQRIRLADHPEEK